MADQPGYDMNNNIKILNMEIKEKESKIKALNEELINYQRKEKINQKQIEDMNNNIFNYEKIIKQKDELINTNYKDNNDVLKIKLENEKLKKQVEELKNINNNYLLQNQRMINGNINSFEMPEMRNQEYITKINELNQEIQNLKQNLSDINESKVKLELDIDKKNDELEGLKQFIFKLQNKLEKNEDDEEERKKRVNTERSEHNKSNNYNTEVNLRDQNASGKNLNKSFEIPKDTNTNLMNKFLAQLNDAEKRISLLQNKNKELQFKLEEKQVEKDFSGYRTEDYNFSNYEEEFDLKKMVNGAREKNRSEDINIDYPGVQSVKDKYKELLQNMHLLEEQVKILISNISCTNKTKPQITQICQLMRIPAKNIQAIIAGKDKKKMLGLVI
jgi:DNA repair exonuclease SbcCD ATPase subunit